LASRTVTNLILQPNHFTPVEPMETSDQVSLLLSSHKEWTALPLSSHTAVQPWLLMDIIFDRLSDIVEY